METKGKSSTEEIESYINANVKYIAVGIVICSKDGVEAQNKAYTKQSKTSSKLTANCRRKVVMKHNTIPGQAKIPSTVHIETRNQSRINYLNFHDA